MRKRILMALLTTVVIGVAAFFVSQPKKDSVEWHKKELRWGVDHFEGRTFTARCRSLLGRVRTQWRWQIDPDEGHALAEKLDKHRAALIEMGYLVERSFATSNDMRIDPSLYLETKRLPKEHCEFAWVADLQSNSVTVIGRPEVLPKWGEMIHKLDAMMSSNNNAATRGRN